MTINFTLNTHFMCFYSTTEYIKKSNEIESLNYVPFTNNSLIEITFLVRTRRLSKELKVT